MIKKLRDDNEGLREDEADLEEKNNDLVEQQRRTNARWAVLFRDLRETGWGWWRVR